MMVSVDNDNRAKQIVQMYSPILLPPSRGGSRSDPPGGSKNNKNKRRAKETEMEDPGIMSENLKHVNQFLQQMSEDRSSLDEGLKDLQKELELKVKAYDTGILEYRDVLEQLVRLTLQEKQSDKIARYFDTVKLESRNCDLKQQTVQLEIQIESNPPKLVQELADNISKLKSTVRDIEKDNAKLEAILAKYESLGPSYLDVLAQYRSVVDEIKTKEWVKEQLCSALVEDSLY